jgi:gas vesicle protein
MGDRHERADTDGGGFAMGFFAGALLGGALGVLFAPTRGSELRRQISDRADEAAEAASSGYRRASETADRWARDLSGRARDAVAKGADEAERYARAARETASET